MKNDVFSLGLFFGSYGDRIPKSIPARLFAFLWTWIGIATMAVITSSITASLMSMVFQPEKMLYGTKVHKKLFKLSYLYSNFALAPGYLNPALYNPARYLKVEMVRKTNRKIIMI